MYINSLYDNLLRYDIKVLPEFLYSRVYATDVTKA